MAKQYTHKTGDGRLVRILATDIDGEYPVAVAIQDPYNTQQEYIAMYRSNLKAMSVDSPTLDLVERNSWEDVAVDTKVFVRVSENTDWVPRYFSHFKDGRVYTFSNGATSWTSNKVNTVGWKQAKLAE